MATYLELVSLVQRPPFRERIQYALWSVAVDFLATGTAEQKTYARKKLRGMAETDELLRLAINCVATPTIATAGETCTDADIRSVVASVFASMVT